MVSSQVDKQLTMGLLLFYRGRLPWTESTVGTTGIWKGAGGGILMEFTAFQFLKHSHDIKTACGHACFSLAIDKQI